MKFKLWRIPGCCLVGLIVCFTLCNALAQEDTSPLPTLIPAELSWNGEETTSQISEEAYQGENYHDASLDVRVYRCRAYQTPVFIAFVQIADPSQLKTEQAQPYPSQTTVNPNMLVKRVGAVLAVNADWFVYHNAGVIYREGELLRERPNEEYDGLAVDVNGDFHILRPLTQEGFAAIQTPISNSFCFGPALVMDGQVCDIGDRKETLRQRTAIGQVGPLAYVLVVTDGPEEKDSVGLTVPQMAQLMKDLGAVQAYNLDGGASSIMFFHQQKVNGQKASKARSIADMIYFVPAGFRREK